MSLVDDVRRRYAQMDEIDRKNLWIAIAAGILIIIVILNVMNTMGVIGSILGGGVEYVNESVQNVQDLSR